jgi:hypothetical protein
VSVSLRDIADEGHRVRFTNDEYRRLQFRGVLMPAGVFRPNEGYIVYVSDDHGDDDSGDHFTATPMHALGCAMAMRTYADAVKYGTEKRREWVDECDRRLFTRREEIVRFFATCSGFEAR